MNKTLKRILLYTTALATVSGTYIGNVEGFPPFYTKKSGTSGGICVGFATVYEPGSRFYGLNLAFTTRNGGEINGVNLSVGGNASQDGEVNGLEMSIVNAPDALPDNEKKDGSKYYKSTDLAGLQVGFYNQARSKGDVKRGFLINIGFGGNEE